MNVREWKTTLNDEIMAPTEAHVQISTFSTPSFSEKFSIQGLRNLGKYYKINLAMAIITQSVKKENIYFTGGNSNECFDHQCRQLQPEVSADEP